MVVGQLQSADNIEAAKEEPDAVEAGSGYRGNLKSGSANSRTGPVTSDWTRK